MADYSPRNIVDALDNNEEQFVKEALTSLAGSMQRENFRTLISSIDKREKDGVGLDLIVKKNKEDTPIRYAILPNELNTSAKKMAELMDQDRFDEAKELKQTTAKALAKKYGTDKQGMTKEFILWSIAVDAYEKDGVGGDVTINENKDAAEAVSWEFGTSKNPEAKVEPDSIAIPALISGEEADKNASVRYPKDSDVAKMYEKVSPSVVLIEAHRENDKTGIPEISYGSGFFVGEDGLVATNHHTFYGFKDITITTKDGVEYKAAVAAYDEKNDVGLLKITPKKGEKFPALEIEPSSRSLGQNQKVRAFTHPMGWSKIYLSEGSIVGATTISKVVPGPNPPNEDPNKRVAVMAGHGEEGSSGGPVLNEQGKVCGLSELAASTGRGQHIFLTLVEPLNALLKRYKENKK